MSFSSDTTNLPSGCLLESELRNVDMRLIEDIFQIDSCSVDVTFETFEHVWNISQSLFALVRSVQMDTIFCIDIVDKSFWTITFFETTSDFSYEFKTVNGLWTWTKRKCHRKFYSSGRDRHSIYHRKSTPHGYSNLCGQILRDKCMERYSYPQAS